MSEIESDREDLLREATALVQRAELIVEGFPEPVVMGFRAQGAASIFLGGEPVYQFNAAGRLRRAYDRGRLVKAERGRLVSLTRHRTSTEVRLLRHELSGEDAMAFLEEARERLARLGAALANGKYRCVGQVPPGTDTPARMAAPLAAWAKGIEVARTARVE
jgi:hypothetical protein